MVRWRERPILLLSLLAACMAPPAPQRANVDSLLPVPPDIQIVPCLNCFDDGGDSYNVIDIGEDAGLNWLFTKTTEGSMLVAGQTIAWTHDNWRSYRLTTAACRRIDTGLFDCCADGRLKDGGCR